MKCGGAVVNLIKMLLAVSSLSTFLRKMKMKTLNNRMKTKMDLKRRSLLGAIVVKRKDIELRNAQETQI